MIYADDKLYAIKPCLLSGNSRSQIEKRTNEVKHSFHVGQRLYWIIRDYLDFNMII